MFAFPNAAPEIVDDSHYSCHKCGRKDDITWSISITRMRIPWYCPCIFDDHPWQYGIIEGYFMYSSNGAYGNRCGPETEAYLRHYYYQIDHDELRKRIKHAQKPYTEDDTYGFGGEKKARLNRFVESYEKVCAEMLTEDGLTIKGE
jgi:hypothetical protein